MAVKLFPTEKEFRALSKKGNLIPVIAEIQADLETPVSAFLKVCKGTHGFLFESVEQGEKLGRYSFLGTDPKVIFESRGKRVSVRDAKGTKRFTVKGSPLDYVKEILRPYRFVPVEGLPRFCGGLVGFIGYDMVRFFEKIPDRHQKNSIFPDCTLLLIDRFVIFDHLRHAIKIVALAHVKTNASSAYRQAQRSIADILKKLKAPLRPPAPISVRDERPLLDFKPNMSREAFEKKVMKAKDYIRRGDAVQIVLSQRFEIPFSKNPFQVYRALRSINPSPYMFYLKLGLMTLVGSSPEIFVQCEDGKVRVRPIAGTRRRGKTAKEDLALEKELLASHKERAEHVMLVDLGRNDIGRVCKPGSVRVTDLMIVERYSHVMHVVSEVTGELRDGEDEFALLRATFPAGTVTGAPKIRAMEVIDELEETRRGPYAGCVGYFSFSKSFDSCITIRTLFVTKGKAYVQAGAGIVADSEPRFEYEETVNKAKAVLQAVACAQ